MNDVWPQLWLSVQISLGSTLLVAIIGLPLAALLARRRFIGKSLLEALLFVPLVLPPTVVGFLLLALFGANGPLGRLLLGAFHYSIIFRVEGAILAAFVVSFPLVYLPAKAGFASIGREYIDLARVLGVSRWTLFWQVLLPLGRRPIISGLILAFARALGEFGATNMIFGWRVGKTTLPISVYADYEQGATSHAIPAVLTLVGLSLLISLVFNLLPLTRPESQH